MLRLFYPIIVREGFKMDKIYKIGRYNCKHCGADRWIEAKYEITKCEYCQVAFLVKYNVDEIVDVSINEINKLKELDLFYDIPDTFGCIDRYKTTYFICYHCKKGQLIDPSNGIIVCESCSDVFKTDDVISAEDKKYIEDIKRIKEEDINKINSVKAESINSKSSINVKQAQRIENKPSTQATSNDNNKDSGFFSKFFKKQS